LRQIARLIDRSIASRLRLRIAIRLTRPDSAIVAGVRAEFVKTFPILFATTTTIASSQNPSVLGSAVTFTATVTGMGGGTPTGTVTFLDGKATLGTSSLNSSDVATFSTSSLTVGSHTISARYNGDANFNSGTSANLIQTVTTTTATTLVNSIVAGKQAAPNGTRPITPQQIIIPAPSVSSPSNRIQSSLGLSLGYASLVQRLGMRIYLTRSVETPMAPAMAHDETDSREMNKAAVDGIFSNTTDG
jgi:hypothetical protein